MARGRGGHVGRIRRARDFGVSTNIDPPIVNHVDNETSPGNNSQNRLNVQGTSNSGTRSNDYNTQNLSQLQIDGNQDTQFNDNTSSNPSSGQGLKQLHIMNGLVNISSDCSRTITKKFKERIDAGAYTWRKVPYATKKFYFEEFRKHYTWDSKFNAQVWKAWESKASERYTDLLRDVRGKSTKPTFITDDVWRGFRAYWDTPTYKEKREINTQNRRKGEGSSRHTGGSISYGEYAKILEAKLGHPPTPYELFLHTHAKDHDNKTFVDEKAKAINDNMLRLREKHQTNSASGEDDLQPVSELALYLEAVGGEKKRRVYGVGSQASKYYLSSGNNSISTNSEQDQVWEKKCSTMQRTITTLKQTVEMLCSHAGVPVPSFDDEVDSNAANDPTPSARTSCSEADESVDRNDHSLT